MSRRRLGTAVMGPYANVNMVAARRLFQLRVSYAMNWDLSLTLVRLFLLPRTDTKVSGLTQAKTTRLHSTICYQLRKSEAVDLRSKVRKIPLAASVRLQ